MSTAVALPQSRVGAKFFLFSGVILGIHLLVGLIAAAQYVWPAFLADILPFNMARMLHINGLVVWLLAGFMGATYLLLAEEAGGRLHSEKAGTVNFWMLAGGIAAVIAGYLYMAFSKNFSLAFSEGREYIEAPRWADWAVVAVMLFFVYNIYRTLQHSGRNVIGRMLLLGLTGLSVFYLFGMKFIANMATDFYFWWWVIHLWVEGVWEIIAAALYAFLLIRLFDFPRERAIKYMYIEAGLVLFTGILGTGHHYYWAGTPGYWLLVGGVFSALEPLPLLVMVVDALRIQRAARAASPHPNTVARWWLVAGVVVHFLGAGVGGFIQTLPQVNQWSHGTQLTAAHGHLAFFGAYGMLVLAVMYYALPRLRFGSDLYDQRRGKWAFWLLTLGMFSMTGALFGAAMVQITMERMGGLPYMETQSYMSLFYTIRFWSGAAMFAGLVLFLADLFALKPVTAKLPPEPEETLVEHPAMG